MCLRNDLLRFHAKKQGETRRMRVVGFCMFRKYNQKVEVPEYPIVCIV
jgi:hypothetical protein